MHAELMELAQQMGRMEAGGGNTLSIPWLQIRSLLREACGYFRTGAPQLCPGRHSDACCQPATFQ